MNIEGAASRAAPAAGGLTAVSARLLRPARARARFRAAELALTGAAFALYLALGLRLAAGDYFSTDNLAFDFDAGTYAAALFGEGGFSLRHPFLLIVRQLCLGLLATGLPYPAAMSLFFAAIGAATVLLVCLFLAEFGLALPERMLLSALYAVSSTQLFNGIVADAYGLSALGLAALFLGFVRRLKDPGRDRILRFAIAVYLFGVTISNVAQAAIAEAIVWSGSPSLRAYIRRLLVFGTVTGALIVAGVLICAPSDLLSVHGLQAYYWNSLSKGEERASLVTLVETAFGYTFVAPQFTAVPLPNGEATMLDFRELHRMSGIGAAALALWLLLLCGGIAAAALRARRDHKLLVFLVSAIAVNLFINLHVQYRLSVYLYSSHLQIAILTLAAFALRTSGRRPGPVRLAAFAGTAALLILAGCNNLQRALELVTAFG